MRALQAGVLLMTAAGLAAFALAALPGPSRLLKNPCFATRWSIGGRRVHAIARALGWALTVFEAGGRTPGLHLAGTVPLAASALDVEADPRPLASW
jgi:hypothetical protein